MSKKIQGYIRDIPNGTPLTGISVAIKDDNTGTNIPIGGMINGSTNPVTTDAITGLFTWTCELSPGPVRIDADLLGGKHKIRSGREQMQSGDVFISDTIDFQGIFTSGIAKSVGNEFGFSASGLVGTLTPGGAIMKGRYLQTLTNRTINIPVNVTLAERWDLLVLQQWVGGTSQGKQNIQLVTGTISGVDPVLNSDPNILEFAIWRSKIANGGGSVTLTDLRTYSTFFIPNLAVSPVMLSNAGVHSTAELAQLLKADTTNSAIALTTLALGELNNVSAASPAANSALVWDGSQWIGDPTLDAVARVTIRENAGADVGARRRLNFNDGMGINVVITDDAPNEEVDIQFLATPMEVNASQDSVGTDNGDITSQGVYQQIVAAAFTLPTGTWTVEVIGGALFSHDTGALIDRRAELTGETAGAVKTHGVPVHPTREHYPYTETWTSVSSGAKTASIKYKINPAGANHAYARGSWIRVHATRTA